jgi:hypothetical protein
MIMKKRITRREFLKVMGTTAAVAVASPIAGVHAQEDPDAWILKGRAIHTVYFYKEPSTDSEQLATRTRDQSFRIFREVHAPFSRHNDLWYKTLLGYVHSAWVLPVRVYPPQPFIRNVGDWGFWGEVSQVYTEAYAEPSPQARRVYRFYGGTVYHVVDAFEDEEGRGWYKIYDEFPPTSPRHQWVLARDMRRIPRSEMAPLHPFVGDKRIDIDLGQQTLTCYEGEENVFTTAIASGLGGELNTPLGQHHVLLKQASRHMSNVSYPGGPEPLGEIFDLPGVPWNTFFDLSGTAIHGAYWHNDFGIRRSHGCVNVSCDAARWIYRWVHPVGGYEDDFIQSDYRVGTPIYVF